MRTVVLGMGRMGRALAARLIDTGHDVTVWNRTPGRADEVLRRGAREVTAPAEALAGGDVDVVCSSLADDAAVLGVLAPGGVALWGPGGPPLVDTSTTAPATARRLADLYGGNFVASPVLGSPQALAAGQATLAIAGPDDVVGRLEPLWTSITSMPRRFGTDPGRAQVVKLLNNYLLMAGIAALAEAVAAGEAAGLGADELSALFAGLATVAPALRNRIDDIVGGDHGGWFSTVLAAKDVGLLVESSAATASTCRWPAPCATAIEPRPRPAGPMPTSARWSSCCEHTDAGRTRMLIEEGRYAAAAPSDQPDDQPDDPEEIERARLTVGPLLATGGEGLVHEIVGQPDSLYKSYKVPVPREPLLALVRWPREMSAQHPAGAARVRAASAWPTTVVVDPDSDLASGTVLPRAPQRFWLRHRDGSSRLASLSYLTADPGQRAAAYGLALPPPMAVERLGLAYALARLLDALGSASPAAGHGDLSAKNVLWSLERGPEVYLIDCDNTELFGVDGTPVTAGRRRAMTPNWDDPSIPAGANPDLASDRYSLALIFLRIVGAAHFPIQVHQRRGETVPIDFEVPGSARRLPSLERGAPLWRLVARGLSTADPSGRPAAGEWAATLETVLAEMGASATVRQTWAAQEGLALAEPTLSVSPVSTRPLPTDVTVRPVSPTPRSQARRIVAAETLDEDVVEERPMVAFRRFARYAMVWWWLAHRRMVRTLITRGRHLAGIRRFVFLFLVDFGIGCVALFLVGMIVSPFLGL